MSPVAAAAVTAVSSPSFIAAAAAAAAVASSSQPLFFPTPKLSTTRLLSTHRSPSLLRFQALPPPRPLQIARRPGPSPSLAISAVAVPSFLPSRPPAAVSSVLKLARPLPRLLLASVRSLPAQITAAAARAAPTPEQLAAIRALFSAALANRPPGGYFKLPLQAVASGAASWIGLYAEILSVRCLLSWFPNIPWERQPFSALRDLCDPYLVLCRSIVPPINGFDVSPLLGFWVLGLLTSLLNSNARLMN